MHTPARRTSSSGSASPSIAAASSLSWSKRVAEANTLFEKASAVERVDETLFRAELDPTWWVVRGPHGGYMAAIILRALTEVVDDPERPVRSFTTHFVAAPKEGPVEIEVTLERKGRSITHTSARLSQEGKVMATSLAAFSTPWTGLDFDLAPPPELAPPDECFKVPSGGFAPRFVDNFDMRWGIGDLPYSGSDQATIGGYLRFEEPQMVDAPATACLLDAWAPVILPRASEPVVAPTIDITMHFRAPLPLPQARRDDFFVFRMSSMLARDGFFEEDGDLWSADGTLIAQCRQLAIALPIG